jgi:hypothetical protein
MALIFAAAILLGIALVLTGYKPGSGYGPPPKHETCEIGPDWQAQCKERDR